MSRLIDADALLEKLCGTTLFIKDSVVFQRLIDNAPTIEPSGDIISRADAIAYIDRVTNSGLGRNKSLEYIRKYISALPSAEYSKPLQTTLNDDLISREDAKREVYLLGKNPSINDIWGCLDSLPSAEATTTERLPKGILVPNMEMPEHCDYCKFHDADWSWCDAKKAYCGDGKCPLIEVDMRGEKNE